MAELLLVSESLGAILQMPDGKIKKIGVILDTLGSDNTAALRYAILRLNTLQTFAEFELIYDTSFNSELIDKCSTHRAFSEEEIKDAAKDFDKEIEDSTKHSISNVRKGTVCDRYIAVCNCWLKTNYYLIGTDSRLRLLFTGKWKTTMAPPSLLEFIVHHCLLQGIRSTISVTVMSHFPSKGCLFDFNQSLENCRNSILTGYVCSDCKNLGLDDQLLSELDSILGGKWLGTSEDPLSAYSELRRLGHNPFQSSRVKQTWREKIVEVARTKFVEEIVKYLVLATFLYLALKLGLQPLVDKL